MKYRFSPASPLFSLGLELKETGLDQSALLPLPDGELLVFAKAGRFGLEGGSSSGYGSRACLALPGRDQPWRLHGRPGSADLAVLVFDRDPLAALEGGFSLDTLSEGWASPWSGGARAFELPIWARVGGILGILAASVGQLASDPGPAPRGERGWMRNRFALEFTAAASLAQILALVLASPEIPEEDPGGGPRTIEALIAWIDTHYGEHFSLDEVAAGCALNVTDFSRRFKAAAGHPLFEYLNRRRIARAALLLRDGDLPVIEVALAVGYNSLTFFNRYFLRLMGQTPSEYRRSVR
ncbi:MAG: helix-turn-helix transcriptional regulator [Rectinemataceae bacterium]